MPMIKTLYTFTINIAPSGNSLVEYPVSKRELKLIQQAVEECECFCDVEELEDLYERVMVAAKEKLQEDVDLTGDDIDVDELDFDIDFGEQGVSYGKID